VDKWADYEDEIHQLQVKLASNQAAPQPPQTPTHGPITNRLSIFTTSRKITPVQSPQTPALTPVPITPHEEELITALTREQVLRHEAEGRLSEASGELEELSAQLFMQANEMVATERKARAKLEERVALLESRDVEKRKRLERLELAMSRIERVRGILAPGSR
jgi:GDP/GTP exchange factor Sec2p